MIFFPNRIHNYCFRTTIFSILVIFLNSSAAQDRVVVEFILTNNFASGIIRGEMISSFLNELPHSASRAVQLDKFHQPPDNRPEAFQTVDFCICVKCYLISDEELRDMIDHCHDLGGMFGWDIIDYFPSISEIHYHVDFWLVTNSLIQNFLVDVLIPPDRIFLWPHPHTNFQTNLSRVIALSSDIQQQSQLTVGFTASPRNMYVMLCYVILLILFNY